MREIQEQNGNAELTDPSNGVTYDIAIDSMAAKCGAIVLLVRPAIMMVAGLEQD
jgi:hypothetical protein